MQTLKGETKKYYEENPEGWEIRKQLDWDILCDRLSDKMDMTSFAQDFEKMWKVAKSYDVIPDMSDYTKIVNRGYD